MLPRTLARTHFHSSQLARVLAELVGMDALASQDAFAQKLGQWIAIADAIALRATHTPTAATPAGVSPTNPSQAHTGIADIADTFAQARAALEKSLRESGGTSTRASAARTAMPLPKKDVPLDIAGAYAPYRRYYIAHQHVMDLKVKPLRAQVREAVGGASPALQQLAALDAALETTLADRESLLLTKVPTLLEKRFKQLRQAHQDMLLQAQQEDSLALWMQPGGWLARFCHELQTVLLAELDLRLQPTVGLLEALHNPTPEPV